MVSLKAGGSADVDEKWKVYLYTLGTLDALSTSSTASDKSIHFRGIQISRSSNQRSDQNQTNRRGPEHVLV